MKQLEQQYPLDRTVNLHQFLQLLMNQYKVFHILNVQLRLWIGSRCTRSGVDYEDTAVAVTAAAAAAARRVNCCSELSMKFRIIIIIIVVNGQIYRIQGIT
jgi:hypothetical protein